MKAKLEDTLTECIKSNGIVKVAKALRKAYDRHMQYSRKGTHAMSMYGNVVMEYSEALRKCAKRCKKAQKTQEARIKNNLSKQQQWRAEKLSGVIEVQTS